MNPLKTIWLAIVRVLGPARWLPRSQLQIDRNEREAERLDRLRHPSKYLGK